MRPNQVVTTYLTFDRIAGAVVGSGFLAAALCASACGGLDPSDEDSLEGVGSESLPLWEATGARHWIGNVPVCFDAGVSTGARKLIQDTLENGWEAAGAVNFNGWSVCGPIDAQTTNLIQVRTSIAGSNGHEYKCADATNCVDWHGKAPDGDFNRVDFLLATPAPLTILHEFGHALGFMHETDESPFCVQRTSGGTSWEYEGDYRSSVMAAYVGCNSATQLSSWDIMGMRASYGFKPPGTLVGVNGLTPNIAGGGTNLGASVNAWDGYGYWNNTFKRRSETSLLLTANSSGVERVINVQGGVTSPSALTPVISWDVGEADTNSQFVFQKMNWLAMGNMCVVVPAASAGSELFVAPCNEGAETLKTWDFFNGDRRIRLNGSSLCVEVPGGATADGTKLKLATCSTASTQKFTFSNSKIVYGGKNFNVAGGTTNSGNRIILYTASDAHLNSRFTILGKVRSLGQCLDMNGAPALGTQLGVRTCNTVSGANYVAVKATNTQVWEYFW
ncbi:ricin-type beta-trefoil lectin domain protein [Sorangium sp. So ce429]